MSLPPAAFNYPYWSGQDIARGYVLWYGSGHSQASGYILDAWEGSSLLVAMAARTQTIQVGVMVFDALLRHPFMVAGSVALGLRGQ